MDAQEWSRVDEIVVACTQDLFNAFGVQARHSASVEEGRMLRQLTLAVIGFAGQQMRGSLLVSAEQSVLAQSHPTASASKPPEYEELRDWSGEIANQLLGRIKNKLLGHGIEMQLSIPTTLSGLQLRIGASAQNAFCLPHLFETSDGAFQVRFEAVAGPDVHLGQAIQGTEGLNTEGDLLLF